MLKTLRFYLKYAGVMLAGYAVFVAIILVGAFVFGLEGLVGTYVSMLPSMSMIFVCIFSMGSSGYQDVALSMGARRTHCFWAAECSNLLQAAGMVLLAVLARQLLGGLPDPEGVLYDHGPRAWLCIVLVAALTIQVGLIGSQLRDPKKSAAVRLVLMLAAMVLMVATAVTGVLGLLDTPLAATLWPGWAVWLLHNLPLLLAAGTVLLGAVALAKYRKAVVYA